MKDTFTQFIRLGVWIVILAVGLFAADAFIFAPGRLPVCVQEQLPEGRICLENLLKAWQDPQAPGQYRIVWVDARSESDYELHHLMLNENRVFPIRPGEDKQQLIDAAVERLMEAGSRDECIVVFCTADCTTSSDIARELKDMGLFTAPIYVLEGGWPALKRSALVKD